jgi:hypothetical protein
MRSRIHTVHAPEQACCFLPRLSRLASHLPWFVLFRGAGLFKRTQRRSGGCSKPSLEMGAGRRTDSDARDVSYCSESVGTNSGPESAATRLLRARRRCLYHQNVVHRAPPRRCHSAAAPGRPYSSMNILISENGVDLVCLTTCALNLQCNVNGRHCALVCSTKHNQNLP